MELASRIRYGCIDMLFCFLGGKRDLVHSDFADLSENSTEEKPCMAQWFETGAEEGGKILVESALLSMQMFEIKNSVGGQQHKGCLCLRIKHKIDMPSALLAYSEPQKGPPLPSKWKILE